jgi:hypothetical protein
MHLIISKTFQKKSNSLKITKLKRERKRKRLENTWNESNVQKDKRKQYRSKNALKIMHKMPKREIFEG